MNEDENFEDTEILDDSSVETVDEIAPDKRDEQIANLNKALSREREQNKRLKQSYVSPVAPQTNDDGSIDPAAFAQSIIQQNNQQTQQIIQDERDWNKATKKYPELEEDEDLEDSIRGYRNNVLVKRGEIITYAEAADRVLGKFKKQSEKNIQQAEVKGRTDAQVSERIQERAVIDAPSGGKENAEANKRADIMAILYNPDSTDAQREAAREKLLSF